MRITLDSADDVLFAAKETARREKKSLGELRADAKRLASHHEPGQLTWSR